MKTITYDETKWRLVPIEPTEEMLFAADWPENGTLDAYRAMLDAAPHPEDELTCF